MTTRHWEKETNPLMEGQIGPQRFPNKKYQRICDHSQKSLNTHPFQKQTTMSNPVGKKETIEPDSETSGIGNLDT